MIELLQGVLIQECSVCQTNTDKLVDAGYYIPLCNQCYNKLVEANTILNVIFSIVKSKNDGFEKLKQLKNNLK